MKPDVHNVSVFDREFFDVSNKKFVRKSYAQAFVSVFGHIFPEDESSIIYDTDDNFVRQYVWLNFVRQ